MVETGIKEKRIIKSNKSVYFVLPMLRIMSAYYRHNLLNCYLSDNKNRPNIYNYHIFMLVKKEDEKLLNMPTYREHYEVDEGIMYVFRVPEEFEEDYLKFILGQYSQFSAEYKTQLIKLLPAPHTMRSEFKVIMKTDDAKAIIEEMVGQSIGDQEVMSIPDLQSETYE